MNILDVIYVWFTTMKAVFFEFSAVTRYEESPTDRPNPSCSMNIRLKDREADLVVWSSGEAELVIGEIGDVVEQVHFDDLKNRDSLLSVLSRLTEFTVSSNPR